MNLREQVVLDKFRELRQLGGLRYRASSPRALSNEVAKYFGFKSETQLELDGLRVFTTRLSGLTRFSLFAKVADWDASGINSSAAFLTKFGNEDAGLNLRLNCTIKYRQQNSFGLKLNIDKDEETLFVSHSDAPNFQAEVWGLGSLSETWMEKKSEFVIVEFQVEKQDSWETAIPSRLTYFAEPKLDFEFLLKNDYLQLDHLLSKVGGTVRERGPLFKLERSALDLRYSLHRKHVL